MNLNERIQSLSTLGEKLLHLSDNERELLNSGAARENSWFIPESVQLSIEGLSKFLNKEKLSHWASLYPIEHTQTRKVGIAMAGNIPLVGFHDFLSVLISGHQAIIKLSSQDSFLLKQLTEWLIEIDSRFKDFIRFTELLKGVDAIIATGSDNTARYFEYYFRNIPHIIRKNRSSCAVIMGEESENELSLLGKDVFSYFGLGCRSISKIYIPDDYHLPSLLNAWDPYKNIIHHHRYANNYDYQKSILLINKTPFLDSGYLLVTENTAMISPISVLHYETYSDQFDLSGKIDLQREKLQCIVSANAWFKESVPFGTAQQPELWDYADGIDTLRFLTGL